MAPKSAKSLPHRRLNLESSSDNFANNEEGTLSPRNPLREGVVSGSATWTGNPPMRPTPAWQTLSYIVPFPISDS